MNFITRDRLERFQFLFGSRSMLCVGKNSQLTVWKSKLKLFNRKIHQSRVTLLKFQILKLKMIERQNQERFFADIIFQKKLFYDLIYSLSSRAYSQTRFTQHNGIRFGKFPVLPRAAVGRHHHRMVGHDRLGHLDHRRHWQSVLRSRTLQQLLPDQLWRWRSGC